jgi:Uma2 family endonuclease
MPLIDHEEPKVMLSNFVEVMADELEIEIRELGSLTLEREDLSKAIEPDTCFYIPNERLVRGVKRLNFSQDPPPDLAIESDYTNSSLNKHEIYAGLGVPELWRYREKALEIYQGVCGSYQRCDCSLAFPDLPVAEVPLLIEGCRSLGQRATVRQFRDRFRALRENSETITLE